MQQEASDVVPVYYLSVYVDYIDEASELNGSYQIGLYSPERINPRRSIAAGFGDAATWRACARVCDQI
jgi:hypothetical protein